MIYFNNNNPQHILSCLDGSPNTEVLKTEPIFIDKQIAILTNLNENSVFIQQLKLNNIKYYLPEEINNINEPYTLIVYKKDALIVDCLDNNFINKFLNFNKDYVFCGMTVDYPFIDNPIYDEFDLLPSENRYINSSLCFGYTDLIIKIFTELINIDTKNIDNNENEYLIYSNHNKNFKFSKNVDLDNKLFTTIYDKITNLIIENDCVYLINSVNNNYLIFNKEDTNEI